MSDLISIIIPTWNSEKTLSACIESIVNQSYPSLEIIVVDGGSTDGTRDIVSQYAKTFDKIIFRSEPDRGIYDAMNKGVKMSTGKWLYFIGSDDVLDSPRAIESVFRESIPKGKLIVYGRVLVTASNFVTPIDFYFGNLVKYNICHQAIFYAREVFENYEYSLNLGGLADWDLNLRVVAKNRKCLHAVDVMVCRYSGTGLTANWRKLPEYKKYFADPLRLYWRYLPLHLFVWRVSDVVIRRIVRYFGRQQRVTG
jgi:glycosyltransferase involved in cell wall biosynthesis